MDAPATGSRAPLLELGPSTAATLADRLGLSPAAIRRHLDAMVAEGALTSRDARPYGRRARGRPAAPIRAHRRRARSLRPPPTTISPSSALHFLADRGGEDAVRDFAAARAGELGERLRGRWTASRLDDRPEALAAALSADGYAAGSVAAPRPGHSCASTTARSRTSPRSFPQLCEAETAMLSSPARYSCSTACDDRPWRRRMHHPRPASPGKHALSSATIRQIRMDHS